MNTLDIEYYSIIAIGLKLDQIATYHISLFQEFKVITSTLNNLPEIYIKLVEKKCM